ncbi:MAG TPA: branched-chain amino acid ABC transporter substrate-binding protein [Phototrophicaceae bacterium]|jgi:branched-chain amino acid transport system substrate-binding protein|nr:branched-chain amino acid ABC transporter substrate-binding protein [Phototrophicaceae bacterium]
MKNLLRKLPLLLVMMLLAVIVAPLAFAQDSDIVTIAPGDNVVLGLATILSGEGLVPLGDDITRGVELALDDRPSVTVGGKEFTLKLDIQDDQCSAEGGQAVANYFVSQPSVVAIVGPTCSSACRAAGPIFDENGFSMISSSCTAVDLTAEDTGFASFNRTAANDAAQGAAAADFIYNGLGLTSIATIHDGSPYGEGLVEELTANFTELGGEVVYADAINVGDTDFRNLLDSVAGSGAELIYFGGFPAEAARIATQRADVGLEDTPMMGADGINNTEFVNLGGDSAEGVYASSPVPPVGERVDAFVARYKEKYGVDPTAPFNTYSYDATNILLDAIEATGTIDDSGNLIVSRSALAEFVRAYGSEEPFDGLSGVLSCDGTGECATGGIGFFQVTDGAYVRLEMATEPVATEEAGG